MSKIEIKAKVDKKILSSLEKKVLSSYKLAYKNISSELSLFYSKYGNDGVLDYANAIKYNRLLGLEKKIKTEIKDIQTKVKKDIVSGSSEFFNEQYFRNGYEIETVIAKNLNIKGNVNLSFSVLKKERVEAILFSPFRGVAFDSLGQNALLGVKRELTQSLILGESYFKASKRIKDKLGVNTSQALTIARTELGKAGTLGQLQAIEQAEKSGVVIKKRWDATLDEKTRKTHGRLDGKYADEDGFFHYSGYKAKGPRLWSIAAMDTNCRCTIIEELVDYPVNERWERGVGVTDYKTYNEWADSKK